MRTEVVIFILSFIKNNIIGCLFALLIAVGLTAGVFTYGTDDMKYGTSVIGPLLGCLILMVAGYRTGVLSLPLSATFISLCAFFGYLLLSTAWASVSYTGTYFVMIFLLTPMIFWAVVCTGQPGKMLPFALMGAGAVVSAVMLWALYQLIFKFGGDFGVRVRHPFLDPNNLAVFMNMAFLPLLALTFRHQPRRHQILYAVLTLLFFIALIATNSRMALLAAIAGFLVLMPVVIRQTRYPTITALALLAAGAIVLLIMNQAMEGALFLYMREILNFEKSVSMTDRMALWMSAARIFEDHFWLGTGLASFYYYYPQYRQPTDSSDGYFVHMDPLQVGLETGIAGYVLMYVFLICVLSRTVRVMRLPPLNGSDRLMVLAPFTGLLTVCIHMHMTFCLYLPAITIPVGVLLAWWYVVTQRYLADKSISLSDTKKGHAASVIVMIMAFWGIIWAAQANAGIYLNQRVATAAAEDDFVTARSWLRWQYALSPYSSYRPYEREADMYLQQLRAARGRPVAERRVILDRGLQVMDAAIKRQPRHGSLRNVKAMMLYVAGDDVRPGARDEAISTLRGILRTDPMMIESRLGLAMLLRERGESGAAVRLLNDGMIWPRPKGVPDVNYITTTAKYNLLTGDQQKHDQLMEFAAERARMYGFTIQP